MQVLFVGSRLPYVLASVGADGFLRLWNAKQLQLLAEIHVSSDGLSAVCVDPGQFRLAVADASGNVHIYCIANWKHGKSKQPVRSQCKLPECPSIKMSLGMSMTYWNCTLQHSGSNCSTTTAMI